MSLNYTIVRPDPRPFGPSGTVLFSKPGARYGWEWGYISPASVEAPIEILSITVSPSSLLAGTGLLNPSFTIAYSGTPSGANITTAGTGVNLLSSPFTSFTWSDLFSTGIFDSTRQFTVNVTGLNGVASGSVSVSWMSKQYWGPSASGAISNSFISGLSGSQLNTTNAVAGISINAGTGYGYYAFANVSTPIFTELQSNIGQEWDLITPTGFKFVNEAGYSSVYNVYRTNYPEFGARFFNVE